MKWIIFEDAPMLDAFNNWWMNHPMFGLSPHAYGAPPDIHWIVGNGLLIFCVVTPFILLRRFQST